MSLDVTIVIPTFNGEEFLDQLLEAVFNQTSTKSYEVLIIDSGSSDKTLEIIKDHQKVRLRQIPNKEFGHGRTRNLAISVADSEFVVFLTQDAVPEHNKWLDYLLEPFSINKQIACVYGKQTPRKDCIVSIKREVAVAFNHFGPVDGIVIHRKTDPVKKLNTTNYFFSDVNSAVRKSILVANPFRDIDYSEDQALGIDLLNKGYFKAYSPLGSVYHSHNYTLKKYFKRKFDESIGINESTKKILTISLPTIAFGVIKMTLHDYVFIIRDKDYSLIKKLHDSFWSPFYNLANLYAIRYASKTNRGDKNHKKFSLEAKTRDELN